MGPQLVRIEILYVGGCPNRHTTVKRVWEALKELGVAGEVTEVRVDPTVARVLAFRGSPTVLVNGTDIERSAEPTNNGLMFRTYREGEQIDGAPSQNLIRQAILGAANPNSKRANQ